MGKKHFIESIKSSLLTNDLNKENKKKSLQELLEKLKRRKISILKSLESSLEKKELQEDLDIISLHIKKGEKLLHDIK